MFARRGLVVEVIYAPLIGGSETLAFTLCKHWKSQGIETRICCLYEREGALTAMFEEAGIAYDLMDIGDKPMWQRWWLLARYFWKWRPRAIHVHHLGSLVNVLLPAWITGHWNIVYTEHSSLVIAKTEWMKRAVPLLSRCVRKVTCVSNKLVDFFGSELGVPTRKLVTVYNGVDTFEFRPRSGGPRGAKRARIGAVGRLVDEKDYPMFLRALALLKQRGRDFEAVIVGDGPLSGSLQALAQSLGLDRVLRFYGRRDDVPELLRAIDIYVLTSKSEGMPIAVLEAMATGLPIVATAVDAVPEVITHEVNGLLVAPGDERGVADALERLLDDPALRERLGKAALGDVRTLFSIQNATQLYAEYLGIAS